MKFEKLSADSEHECAITFDSEEEAELIRAVYGEHIVSLAKKGNIGSISKFDRKMATYESGGEYKPMRFISADGLIRMIEDFHENTDTAVTEIALQGSEPDHDNWHVVERLELGEKALELSQLIREEVVVDDFMHSLNQVPETDQ